MEAVSFAWLHGFKSASILTGFHGRKASNFHDLSSTFEPRSNRDRVTIVRWSWSWSSVDPRRLEWSRFRGSVRAIAARSRRDHGSIAPRSRVDREVLPPRLCTVRWRSYKMDDHDSLIPCATIELRALRQPSDHGRLDEVQASAWWRSDAQEDSTRFQKSRTIATVRSRDPRFRQASAVRWAKIAMMILIVIALRLMKIPRSRSVHVASGKRSDPIT